MSSVYERDYMTPPASRDGTASGSGRRPSSTRTSTSLQEEMRAAAANLDFEKAASLRDDIKRLRNARARAAAGRRGGPDARVLVVHRTTG